MDLKIEIHFNKNPILLLEDNPMDVLLFQEALKELEIKNELIVAVDGAEGLNYLNSGKTLPGIIFCDINMPKINGIEFMKAAKADAKFKYIPIVVLTSSANPSDREAAFGLNAAGYMIKPMSHEDFIKMVGVMMNYWSYSEWYHIPNTDEIG
jgi:CheY-like chemotaxis protein